MATNQQRQAARSNIKKATAAAKKRRTIASMPKGKRSALGRQAAAVAKRNRSGGTEPKTRAELYEEARRANIAGRSRMGRAELLRALRRHQG